MKTREEVEVEKLYKKLRIASSHTFPKKGESRVAPRGNGVYIILSPKNKVLHVGKTEAKDGIHQALQYHIDDEDSPFRRYYLRGDGEKLRRGYQFKCIVVNDEETRAYLEVYTTVRLLSSVTLLP